MHSKNSEQQLLDDIENGQIAHALSAALREAAKCLDTRFKHERLDWSRKDDETLVTTADLESQEALCRVLNSRYPGIPMDSEEARLASFDRDRSAVRWIADPLDGTENFAAGSAHFSVAVGCAVGDEVVAAGITQPITGATILQTKQGLQTSGTMMRPQFDNSTLREARIAFVPHYASRHDSFAQEARAILYSRAWRLVDFWCPSLDWWMLCTGYLDAIITYGAEDEFEDNDIKIGRSMYRRAFGDAAYFRHYRIGRDEGSVGRLEIAGHGAQVCGELEAAFAARATGLDS